MRLLSPPGKLDSTFLYSYEQGISYLENLSEPAKQNYFYAELFDFWFMINYSWLLFIAFNNFASRKTRKFLAFIPGTLDLFETTLITYYLHNREISSAYRLLPIFSSLKWIMAILILLYLGKMILSRRANT